MLEINLLPWRANLRKQRWLKILGVILTCGLVWLSILFWPNKKPTPLVIAIKPADSLIMKCRYIGYVHQGHRTWALLLLPNGDTEEVQEGMPLPPLAAQVTRITEQQVTLQNNTHQTFTLVMSH